MTFAQVLQKVKSQSELNAVLETILTPKEREEIDQRIEILKRLEKGDAQHKIAQALKVGVATVTRGAAVMKTKTYQEHVHSLISHI